MKYLIGKITGIFVIALSVFAISSCTKSFDDKLVSDQNYLSTATTQVYVATVGAARNYVYLDSKPVNGAALAAGNLFPSSGVGFSVPAGFRALVIRDTLSTTTQPQLSLGMTFQGGSSYTIFTYDTLSAIKLKVVDTKIVVPSDTSCRIRFANLAYNGVAVTPSIDILSLGKNEIVATSLPYTAVTEFIAHPTALTGEGFQVREAGTSNVLATVTGVSLAAKRSYTIVYRGSHRNSAGRSVSVFNNY